MKFPFAARRLALSIAAIPALLTAQTDTVVPSGFGYEASGGSWEHQPVVGAQGVRAMQVVSAEHVGLDGETISRISFRHSSFWNQSYASVHRVRIALGYSDLDPANLPAQFSSVPIAPLSDVFFGEVSIPASTSKAIPEGWSIAITLETPWTYDATRGNLVVEVESEYVSGDLRSWPADVHVRTPGGAGLQRSGAGCGALTSQLSFFGSVLEPGGHVRFLLERFPARNLVGQSLLGFPAPAEPLDLGPLGAPGCVVRVDPRARQAASITASLHNATGSVTWSIPPILSLVGMSFDHQVYLLSASSNPLGVVLSTAHRVTIGSPSTTLPQATNMVHGPFGATSGTVPTNPTGWILRLTTD